ncbi:MAG TPA: hypothetical protein VD908_17810 [Cytophagales bacterium]|nr:hypothetical protein [Cytophagales bacterium]
MKVTFKNVGQGDSLILEWHDDTGRKIGIIDCNKKNKTNPVVDHIGTSYSEIEFLILSHPHSDHYSGYNGLLKHVEENDITVKKFAHTLNNQGNDFYTHLKWTEINTEDMEDLQTLVKNVDTLKKKGIIKKVEFISENWSQQLAEGIILKCLSPSPDEVEAYMRLVALEPAKNKKRASSSANYLSTLFSLVKGNDYYLLTSDCELSTFERLMKENQHAEFTGKSLHMGQLPHHGSSENFHPGFWNFIVKNDKRHAVASSGYHLKYKHPHFDVLRIFHEDGFIIHSTNIVHGSEEFLEYLRKLSITSKKLDTVSTLIDSFTGGDKIFELN